MKIITEFFRVLGSNDSMKNFTLENYCIIKKFIYPIGNQEVKENPTEKKRDGLEKKAVSKTAQDCGQKKYLFLPKTPAKENEKVMSDNISMTSDTKSTSKSASGITYK